MYICQTCGCKYDHKSVSKIVALVRFAHWAKGYVKYYDLRFNKKYRIPENKYHFDRNTGFIMLGFRSNLKSLYNSLIEFFRCGNFP